MNREILFRGKVKLPDNYRGHNLSHRNGDWVYGLMNSNESIRGIFVDTNTIGQYTGLIDKNGTKIFEGDILKCVSRLDYANMIVIFEDGEFRMVKCEDYKTYTTGNGYFSIRCFHKEVIGNIYDNPELVRA